MTVEQFGATVKQKHPQYASYSDSEIGQKVLDKYPQYGSRVSPGPSAQPKSLGQKALGVGGNILNFINNNPVSKGITSLAALPVQLGAAAFGQKDPFAQGIGTGMGTLKPAAVSTYEGKTPQQFAGEETGNALQVASLAFPYGSVAKGAGALAKPLLGNTLGRFTGNVASGLAGGYGVDVASNLQEGKQGGEAFKPGLGTLVGGAIPAVPPVLGALARGAGESLGVSTGAQYGVLADALKAAFSSPETAISARQARRGSIVPEQIVEEAKDSLGNLIQQRSREYQQQLAKVTADNTKSFDTSPVQKKLDTMLEDFNVTKTKDGALDFSRSPGLGRYESDLNDIQEVLSNWGSKPGDRTVVGIDRLKQTLDDFRRGTADSRKFDAFVTGLKNSAKDIIKNEPGYSKLVTDYGEKSDLIKDIQKGLSLGDKASIDTSFRKLTTALRTNNEFRKELVEALDNAGSGTLTSKIAGQQLSEVLPRGLARQIEGFGAAGAILQGAFIPLLKVAPFASPRAVGAMLDLLGTSGRYAKTFLEKVAPNGAQFPGDRADVLGKTQGYLKRNPPSLGMGIKDINKMSPEERGALPSSPKALGANAPETFEGFKDITTNLLDDLKGRSTVSKQYVLDALNRQGITKGEREAVDFVLKDAPKNISVKQFADEVKAQLLPLKASDKSTSATPHLYSHYESIALPDEVRGPIAEYTERVYESPIKTSAGAVHFNSLGKDNYFAHSRIEDLPANANISEYSSAGQRATQASQGDTRRVIELQSDLFQKGRLEQEAGPTNARNLSDLSPAERDATLKASEKARATELSKLEPYRNTWHERVIREEVKQAAKDGKTKLQLPTGDTAMRVEGLAGDVGHVPQNAGIGDTFEYGGETMRVIADHGDQVQVIPENAITKEFSWEVARDEEIDNTVQNFLSEAEQGDIERFVEPKSNAYGGKWLSKEFQNGYKKAQKEADKMGSKEPIVNFLSENEDQIRTVAENEIYNQYKNANQMAEYFNDNGFGNYVAQGDTILELDEGARLGVEETMTRGGGELDIDKDNPIYKFYEGDVRKFLQKKFNAKLVTDPQDVTWYEVDVPKEAADQPVKAFGRAKIGALVGGAAATGLGALAAQPQQLNK